MGSSATRVAPEKPREGTKEAASAVIPSHALLAQWQVAS
jgi:hypothetical protein